ncbi:MAG: DUF4386 domain-containing protein [Candidatus Zixiibacteriota bacterium]
MTLRTNARIAGITFLGYIAAGLTSMAVYGRAAAGDGISERLASIAQHGSDMGVVVVLGLAQSFAALTLAVTLYAITRDQDRDLAMLGMISRVVEGVMGGLSVSSTLALQWLATAAGPDAPDITAGHALAAYLFRNEMALSATFFAAGSTFFAWLMLRGRMIPVSLAWLGVVASVLLVIALPLQLAGALRGLITQLIWLPMLLFEVPLALWLIVKGVAVPRPKQVV